MFLAPCITKQLFIISYIAERSCYSPHFPPESLGPPSSDMTLSIAVKRLSSLPFPPDGSLASFQRILQSRLRDPFWPGLYHLIYPDKIALASSGITTEDKTLPKGLCSASSPCPCAHPGPSSYTVVLLMTWVFRALYYLQDVWHSLLFVYNIFHSLGTSVTLSPYFGLSYCHSVWEAISEPWF